MRVNSPSSSSDSEDENKEISSPVKLKSKMTKEKKKGLEEKLRKDSNIRKSHDNALCVLCFDNKADSVIMPCGHGGICNTCALELFSSCNQCPICRSVPKRLIFLGYPSSCFDQRKQKKFEADEGDFSLGDRLGSV